MVDPKVLLVALGVALTVWIGGETVRGVRWVKHHTQAAIHHILHPRDSTAGK